jgi:hypothetical protein
MLLDHSTIDDGKIDGTNYRKYYKDSHFHEKDSQCSKPIDFFYWLIEELHTQSKALV